MTEDHLPELFTIQLDPEAQHMAAFTSKDPTDEQAYHTKWRRVIVDPAVTARVVLVDDELAGSAVAFEEDGELGVTYWLRKDLWGRGVATKALALLLMEIDSRPVHGRVAHDNAASAKVLERNGFVRLDEERSFANARGEEIREIVYVLT